jgi:myxalamid-type nonribosomal peptide synthetase MxaA
MIARLAADCDLVQGWRFAPAEASPDGRAVAGAQAPSPRSSARAVLLTGATGFLGIAVLHELLMRTAIRDIVCLVRAPGEAEARGRLLRRLDAYDPEASVHATRIQVIAGDVSTPAFGLSDAMFASLARRIDTIVHAAARINLLLPYRVLRATNVLGTREVLRLAAASEGATLHHLSSVAVFGASPPSPGVELLETMCVPCRDDVTSGYAQSKWVAEQLVDAAASQGLTATIIRPGLITGHSATGAWPRQDAFSLLLTACLHLGVAPDAGPGVSMLPVDWVGRVIVALTQQTTSTGGAFHIINRRLLAWTEIVATMRRLGYIGGTCPYAEWIALLRQQASADVAGGLMPLASLLPDTPPAATPAWSIDDRQTRQMLANASGLTMPADQDTEWLAIALRWLARQTARASHVSQPQRRHAS